MSGTQPADVVQSSQARSESEAPTASRRAWAVVAANRVAITAFAVHLAVVLAGTTIAMAWFPSREAIPTADDYEIPPMDGIWHYTLQPLSNWDGFWYASIAEHGYGLSIWATAFWPLYPFLVAVGAALTGWSIPAVGVLLSNVALLLALAVLYRLVRLDYGDVVAHRAVWLIALFPTSFYFSALYTESLFLLLGVTAVYLARTERWTGAALAAAGVALTRNTGVLILILLALLLIEQRGWRPTRWWPQVLQLGAAALAPGVFLYHLYRVWGNPLLTLEVQEGWARYRAMPWETIRTAFEEVDLAWLAMVRDGLTWEMVRASQNGQLRFLFAESGAYDLFILLLFVPLAVYMLARVRPAYSLYALAVFALPLFTPSEVHPLMSIPRFVVVLFPFFIALGLLLRNRWLFGAVLVLFTLQLLAQLIQFSTWQWVA